MTVADAGQIIAKRCPGWVVDSVEYLADGYDYTTYVVNGGWVFRFAKDEDAATSLMREACLLPRIEDQFDIRVPSPEVVSLKPSPAFMAYRMLPGRALTQELYLALPEPARQRCAAQLAGFLVQMHATDEGLARRCGVPTLDDHSHYAGVLTDAREHVFARLASPERSFAESWLATSLRSSASSDFRPVVLHGDLFPDNVLYDERSHAITAVIDFGDAAIGDPARDLVYLYEDYGLDFLRRFLSSQPSPRPRPLLDRVFRFHVLDRVERVVRYATQASSELEDAIAELSRLRIECEKRLDELRSVCADT